MRLATTVTVLVLHGGGFTGGHPSTVEPLARDLRAAGYDAIAVDYRRESTSAGVLGQIGAVRRHVRAAELRGAVIAYGVSACRRSRRTGSGRGSGWTATPAARRRRTTA